MLVLTPALDAACCVDDGAHGVAASSEAVHVAPPSTRKAAQTDSGVCQHAHCHHAASSADVDRSVAAVVRTPDLHSLWVSVERRPSAHLSRLERPPRI